MNQLTVAQAMQMAHGHHVAGRLVEAERLYRQVLAQAPDNADALHLLGVLAGQSGHTASAIELIGRAIAINPHCAEYHTNLGESYRRAGQMDGAIDSFRRASELQPDVAMAHFNLGNALRARGWTDLAIAAYHRAIDLRPDDASAHNNLGLALFNVRRYDEAAAAHRRAVALRPDHARAYNNLGNALQESGQPDEAIAAFRRALDIEPDLAEAHGNLGGTFKDQGRLALGLDSLRKAAAQRPDIPALASNLLVNFHFHPDYDAQALLAEHRRWARQYAEPLAVEIQPPQGDRTPGRTLRVGYVSPDFRNHPVGQLVLPLFLHHDRRQTQFVCYSDVRASDALTQEFQARADEWNNITGLSDLEVANRIRGDRIDILVDLALHTAGNRMLVFARKPAPIQVSMLGMPSTTGLDTIDYRLTDRYFDPPGTSDGDYTEQSIRLPHSIWCYQPPDDAPAAGPLPSATNGFVTFGCLNQFAKVSRPALQVWIGILHALAGARLILQTHPGSHLDAVRRVFQDADIAPDRVQFVAKVSRRPYFQRYLDLDLSLDPFPYNGHTSTLDSLWMGVPVVTLAGRTGVGRAGVSVLSNLGLPELIAHTPEQYVNIAVRMAGDLARLAALRAELRPRMQASPLCDGQQYAADVEAAFRRMWQTRCNS